MAQQTAVEWLIKIYLQTNKIDNFDIEQAKQMEKEQIIDAWIVADNELQRTAAEGYYNLTFKQNKFDPNFMHEWIRNNGMRPTKEKE